MTVVCPYDLAKAYREGCLLPFIGAGVSMSVNWPSESNPEQRGPSWSELVDQAIEQLGFRIPRYLGVEELISKFWSITRERMLTK